MMLFHVETAIGLQLAPGTLVPVRRRRRNRVGSRPQADHEERAVRQALNAAVSLLSPFGPRLVIFNRPPQDKCLQRVLPNSLLPKKPLLVAG